MCVASIYIAICYQLTMTLSYDMMDCYIKCLQAYQKNRPDVAKPMTLSSLVGNINRSRHAFTKSAGFNQNVLQIVVFFDGYFGLFCKIGNEMVLFDPGEHENLDDCVTIQIDALVGESQTKKKPELQLTQHLILLRCLLKSFSGVVVH